MILGSIENMFQGYLFTSPDKSSTFLFSLIDLSNFIYLTTCYEVKHRLISILYPTPASHNS
jgi:hypothetical protein